MCTFGSKKVNIGGKMRKIGGNMRLFYDFEKQNGGDNERRGRITSYGLCVTFV